MILPLRSLLIKTVDLPPLISFRNRIRVLNVGNPIHILAIVTR